MMQAVEPRKIMSLIDILLGYTKDKIFNDALRDVQNAQREYLIAEAEDRRSKANAVIHSIIKLDISVQMLKSEYARVQSMLTPDAKAHFDELFNSLANQRCKLVQEKHSLSL